MSNCFLRTVGTTKTIEDFANDVAFEATNDLLFGLSLKCSFANISLCWFMRFHPHDGNPVLSQFF
jgi:hypothetical protein